MPDFNAKMDQNRFWLGREPQAPLEELAALPQTRWLDLRAPTCKGRGGVERGGKGTREGRKAGEEREGRGGDRRVGEEGRGKGEGAALGELRHCCWGDRRPCRLSWLPVSFLLHVKHSLSYRSLSYRRLS